MYSARTRDTEDVSQSRRLLQLIPAPRSGSGHLAVAFRLPPAARGGNFTAPSAASPVSRPLPRPFHDACASPALPSGAVRIPSALSLLSSCSLPCLFHGAGASPGPPRYSPVFRVPCLSASNPLPCLLTSVLACVPVRFPAPILYSGRDTVPVRCLPHAGAFSGAENGRKGRNTAGNYYLCSGFRRAAQPAFTGSSIFIINPTNSR